MTTTTPEQEAQIIEDLNTRLSNIQGRRAMEEAEVAAQKQAYDEAHTVGGMVKGVAMSIYDWFGNAKTAMENALEANKALMNTGMYDIQSYNDSGQLPPKMTPEQYDAFIWKAKKDTELAPYAVTTAMAMEGMAGLASLGVSGVTMATGSLTAARLASKFHTIGNYAALASIPTFITNTFGALTKASDDISSGNMTMWDAGASIADTAATLLPRYGNLYVLGKRALGKDENWNELERVNPGLAWTQNLIDLGQLVGPYAAKKANQKIASKSHVDTVNTIEKPKETSSPQADIAAQKVAERRLENDRLNLMIKANEAEKALKEGKVRLPDLPPEDTLVRDFYKGALEDAKEAKKHPPVDQVMHDMVPGWGGRPVEVKPPEAEIGLVKANEVLDAAREFTAVNTGMMQGMPKNVGGYFNRIHKGVRSRKNFDFPVIAHEIGHFIDDQLRLKGCDEELVRNAVDVWGTDFYTRHELRAEGIAEFTREYTLNPDFARKNYPEYTIRFEDALSKNKALATKFKKFSDMTRQWYAQGERARAGGMLYYQDKARKISNWERAKEVAAESKTQYVDGLAPIKAIVDQIEEEAGTKVDFVKDPYRAAKAAKSLKSGIVSTMAKYSGKNEAILNGIEKVLGTKLEHKVLPRDIWEALDAPANDAKYHKLWKEWGANDTLEAFAVYQVSANLIERVKKVKTDQFNELYERLVANSQLIKYYLKKPEYKDRLKELLDQTEIDKKAMGELLASEVPKNYKVPFDYKAAVRIVEEAPECIKKASSKLCDWNDNVMGLAVHFGLVNQKEAKKMRALYKHWVPFNRMFDSDFKPGETTLDEISAMFDDFTTTGNGANGSIANLNSGLKRTSKFGSDRMIKDPILGTMQQLDMIISRGIRNDVAKKLVNLVTDTKNTSRFFVEIDGRAPVDPKALTFSVMDNGKKRVFQANDPLLYNALTMSSPAQAKNILELIGATTASGFRKLTTDNPSFGLNNMLKDTFFGFVTSKSKKVIPFIPIWDTIEGLYNMRNPKNKELLALMEVCGVRDVTINHRTSKSLKKMVYEAANGTKMSPATSEGVMASMAYYLARMSDGYLKALDDIELAPRLMEAKRAFKEGVSPLEAIERARELTTDFSQGGFTSKKVNQYVPFLNASIQGTRTLFNTLTNKETRGRAWTRVGILAASSVGLWALNHNEAWYRDIDPDIKNRFWLLGAGGGHVFVIPKPEGVGVLCSALERALDYCVDNDEEAPEPLANVAFGAFLPSGTIPLLQPFAELTLNYDFFRGRPVIPKNLEGVSARNQYDPYTSELGKLMGNTFGVSPMAFDHVVKGWFSTTGDTVLLKGSNVLLGGKHDRPAKGPSDLPIVGRFVRDYSKHNAPMQVFGKKMAELQKEAKDAAIDINGATKGYAKLGSKELAMFNKVNSKINKVQQFINEINNPKSTTNKRQKYTAEEKRELLMKAKRQQTGLAIQALRVTGNNYYK